MRAFISLLLTTSVQAGLLIFGILLLQALLKDRLSPRLSYALWLLPALRLLVPFSVESTFPFTNISTPASPAYTAAARAPVGENAAAPLPMTTAALSPSVPQSSGQFSPVIQPVMDWPSILFYIWLIGAVLMLAYMLAVNIRAYGQIRRSRTLRESKCGLLVYHTNCIPSPCLFGLFRPCILVNDAATSSSETYAMTLAHELAHYKQGDHIWALVRNLCNAAYWFHPLVWAGAFKSRRDCELACDARVMHGFSQVQREAYGMALIAMIQEHPPRHSFANISTAMTDGKKELKQRIQRIGTRCRISSVATGLALLLAAALFLFACTKPQEEAAAGLPSPAAAKATPVPTPQSAPASAPMSSSIPYEDTANSKEIADLQKRLMGLGYLDMGEPTQRFDAATKYAVQLFQRQHGLGQDGVVGDQTRDMLYSDQAQPYSQAGNASGMDLESAVSAAILQAYADAFPRGIFTSEAHSTLQVYKQGDTVEVYVFAAYGVYDFVEDVFEQIGGTGAIPLKIVLAEGPEGYSVVNVERPKDGSLYRPSIQELFPEELHEHVLDHSGEYALLGEIQSSKALTWLAQNGYDSALLLPRGYDLAATTSKDTIVKTAKALLGKPYSVDGNGPDSFSSSGLIRACLTSAGEWVPEGDCSDIAAYEGWRKIENFADAQEGDVLFFTGPNGTIQNGGICIGDEEFIHASPANGKVVSGYSYTSYWKAHFAFARRLNA